MKANPLKQSVLLAAVVGLFCLALAAAALLLFRRRKKAPPQAKHPEKAPEDDAKQ